MSLWDAERKSKLAKDAFAQLRLFKSREAVCPRVSTPRDSGCRPKPGRKYFQDVKFSRRKWAQWGLRFFFILLYFVLF